MIIIIKKLSSYFSWNPLLPQVYLLYFGIAQSKVGRLLLFQLVYKVHSAQALMLVSLEIREACRATIGRPYLHFTCT
jgi:hypothetical protein